MRGAAVVGAAGIAAAIGFLLLTGVAGGPIGMLPGGRLSGDAAGRSAPDLGRLGSLETIEIQVRPDRPRSVTTWVVVVDSAVHIPADFMLPFKRWPHLVLEDPRVTLRIDGFLYPGRATRVESASRITELRLAVAAKYDVAPDSLAASSDVWFFRVDFPAPPASASTSDRPM